MNRIGCSHRARNTVFCFAKTMPTCGSHPLAVKSVWLTIIIGSSFRRKQLSINTEMDRLRTTRNGSNTYAEILRRPEITYSSLPIADRTLSEDVTQEVEIQIKYEGYIARDLEQIARFRKLEENGSRLAWTMRRFQRCDLSPAKS